MMKKYVKLFASTFVAAFVASCSDNDELVYNTAETTVGFEKSAISIKENAGIVNIPINIKGKRNGDVAVEIVAQGTGDNPAVEGKHFVITEKNIKLLEKNDTASNTTLNVQFQTLDDTEINDAREVTLTIKVASGLSKVTQDNITITLRDNDAAFYEKFFGKWTLTGYVSGDPDDQAISKTITISGAIDEEDPEYDNILWVSAPALFNVGVSLNCEWPLKYTFDKETKTGTLSHLMNQNYVATYGDAYKWIFLTDDGSSYTDDPIVATWTLSEDGSFPTEISWDENSTIYLYQPNAGYWNYLYDIKISK